MNSGDRAMPTTVKGPTAAVEDRLQLIAQTQVVGFSEGLHQNDFVVAVVAWPAAGADHQAGSAVAGPGSGPTPAGQ